MDAHECLRKILVLYRRSRTSLVCGVFACLVPVISHGQCGTSAIVTSPGDPRGYGVVVTGNANQVGFELVLNGVYTYPMGELLSTDPLEVFLPLECLPPGDHVWRVWASCDGAVTTDQHSGTFSIPSQLPRFDVSVLTASAALGNVKIEYEIHQAGRGALISVIGAAGATQAVGAGAGTVYFNVPPGTYKVRAIWCVNAPNSAMQEVTIQVAATSGPPPSVIFNTPPSDKVLIHKYGSDSYPSPLQTADGKVRVDAVVRTSAGTPVPGKTVYFRLIDPPDTAPYAVQAGDANLPNHGVPGTLNGAAGASAVSNPAGAVSVELGITDFAAGDNYQIQASADPAFNCGLSPCTTSAVYTAWKRVYVESDRMFTAGAFLTQDIIPAACPPAGCPATINISVTDAAAVARASVRGNRLRLIHAPRFDGRGPQTFYYEDVTVIRVDRRNNRLEISRPSQSYFGPDENQFVTPVRQEAFLADAVAVITGDPATDYFTANIENVDDLFTPAFIEYVWVADDAAPFIPFREVVGGLLGTDPEEVALLASKWFYHGNEPNHLHLLAGREGQSAAGATTLGFTRARLGTNWSWIWVNSVIDHAPRRANREWLFNGEVTAHEVAHLWQVNPPVGVTGGHCGTQRAAASPKAYNNPNRFCLMHGTYSGADECGNGTCPEFYDGTVAFHYNAAGSEYRDVRHRPEPLPHP